MNNVANIQKINASELEKGLYYVGGDQSQSSSWHAKYHDSAWVYIGGLSNRLTEGDVVCIMSEYGELEDINLVRDEDTGASRGFAFVKYEDSRSCVLAVDNFTGSQLLGRTLRCDHVDNYRLPKELREREERWEAGHAYKDKELASAYNINSGQDLFAGTETTRKGESEYKLIPEFDDDDDDDYGPSADMRRKHKRKSQKKEAKKKSKKVKSKSKKKNKFDKKDHFRREK